MASAESKRLIDMLRAAPAAEPGMPIEKRRRGMEKRSRPLAPDCTATPVDADGVPAEWVDAPGAGDSVILHLHGGGYSLGSIVSHREVAGRFSRAAGTRVLLIGYRLAPEHPFPAAVEDAVTAYRWLLAQGVPPGKVVVSGDSAGGGLVVCMLLALRDAGVALPAGSVCISPWTDMECTGDSMRSRAALDPMVGGTLLASAATYLQGADPRNPRASPIHGDLTGLPPLLIQVGALEVLFDDATRLDARARTCGVPVRFEAWDDCVHVWHIFAGMLPEGREAIEHIGQFVKEVTAAG